LWISDVYVYKSRYYRRHKPPDNPCTEKEQILDKNHAGIENTASSQIILWISKNLPTGDLSKKNAYLLLKEVFKWGFISFYTQKMKKPGLSTAKARCRD
jgi:hypothetical protein